MSTILDTIIEQKRIETDLLRRQRHLFSSSVSIHRSFAQALDTPGALSIIAEVKKGSPSKGIICENFNPVKIASGYQAGGAKAISVLTDEKFFFGSTDYLVRVRDAVTLPVLRKDFIIDILQVEQTASLGADAMLLIAAALDDSRLKDLYQASLSFNIEPLIEIHSAEELDRVMKLSPRIIGINNRNLKTFKTELSITLEMVKNIPSDIITVSESGIENGAQAKILKDAGVKALLVGESLVKLDNPESMIKEIMCSQGDCA
ncbi:MAG TPA: indole-3-glycerol phosphate synthase TrpC [Chitinispirillaceae bacterium]|nr:indole-3-glycerol phosphate synthase TrpC [Chitinispirillaceae bacterium]